MYTGPCEISEPLNKCEHSTPAPLPLPPATPLRDDAPSLQLRKCYIYGTE